MADEKKTSAMRAALRGLASGASMGFSDEAGGAEQAGLNSLAKRFPKVAGALGIETRYPEGLGDSGDVYKQARDQERREDDQAEQDHPVISLGANLVGGALPAMATGLGGGARLGQSAAKIVARTYASKAGEAGAVRFAEAAAKKAALQAMMKGAAVEGAANAYGHGTRDAGDLGNVGDMLEGAAGGAAGALAGHGIGYVAAKAKGALPSISKGVKQLINPEQEVGQFAKKVGAVNPKSQAVNDAADSITEHFEAGRRRIPGKEGLSDQDIIDGLQKKPAPKSNRIPTKGLSGQELHDAIGHNLDYKDTDWSDLLGPLDKTTPLKMK